MTSASPATTPAADSPVTSSSLDTTAERLSLRERLSYGVGDVGGNLVFAPISAFLLFYLTDVVGIGAAIAGTLLLFGRVMDGTLDLIVGTLIDKTSTRWGKARPWILFSTPVLVISFVLLFNVPAGLSQGGRELYAFAFYFLCLGVGFVSSNLAYHTLLSVITSSTTMRVSLTVFRTFFALITTLVVNAITMPLITALGSGQSAWTGVMIGYAGIATITFAVLFFGTRERVKPAVGANNVVMMPLGLKLRKLLSNPFFFLGFGLFFLTFILQGTSGVGIYFASDVLGDPNSFGLLSVAQLAPMLLGLWFMPRVIGRFGKRRSILFGTVIVVVGSVITLIDPTNLTLVVLGTAVRGFGGIPAMASLFALVADIVDYGEWKHGARLDGMTYAAATAGQNFGAGLGIAIVGWVLAASAYDGQTAVQAPSAISAEIFLQLWFPLIVAIFTGIIVWFLNIDKYLPQIHVDLAARRSAAHSATPAGDPR